MTISGQIYEDCLEFPLLTKTEGKYTLPAGIIYTSEMTTTDTMYTLTKPEGGKCCLTCKN